MMPKANMRYWECECCGHLMVTQQNDDGSEYSCPQCTKSGCGQGAHYAEIDQATFKAEAGIES